MNNYVKIALANDILNATIIKAINKGLNSSSNVLQTLLKQKTEVNKFNFSYIDNIINIYGNYKGD